MRIIFNKVFRENIRNLMRHCGYVEQINQSTGKLNYIRRLGREIYPHFHIYFQESENQLILNLHLDQKRPSYGGSHSHSGEYEDEGVLRTEAERLKNILGRV